MKIFIGSSTESLDLVREIEVWLEEHGHEPMPWDTPGLFPPGIQTFSVLMDISRSVEAAVLVFGSDDRVWYRGDTVRQPRDNVLIEYGLFGGALGPQKAIVCRDGDSKHPVDLAGLTCIDVSPPRRARGKLELSIWARKLTTTPVDPALLHLKAKIFELEGEREQLKKRLGFEAERAQDLSTLLGRANVVDFSSYDLELDGHWKLLFDYGYFQEVARQVASISASPIELKQLFVNAGASELSDMVAWQSPGSEDRQSIDRNSNRNGLFARKMLRLFRYRAVPAVYQEFVERSPRELRLKMEEAAVDSIGRLGLSGNLKQ